MQTGSRLRARRAAKPSFRVEYFLNKGKALSQHESGETVFRQGDPAESVCYLKKGRMMLTVVSPQGRHAIVSLLQAGDFFGEWALLHNHPIRRYTATTLSDCSVCRVPKKVMAQMLQEQPALANRFVAHLLAKGVHAQENLTDQVFHTSEKRLARALVSLAGIGAGARDKGEVPEMNQQTLADLVGASRQHVNRFMKKFRELGFIAYTDHTHQIIVYRSLLTFLFQE